MLRSTFVATIALSLFAGTGLSACNTADPQEIQSAGTVSLPLTTVGSSGARYHLKAFFSVTGGSLAQPLMLGTSSDPAETALTASLDPGTYSIELNDHWSLLRADEAGGLAPVDATLESTAVQTFGIKSEVTTTVSYRFKVDGQVVTTGPGTLSVGIAVDDSPPAPGGYYEFGMNHGYAWVASDQVGTTVSSKDFSSVAGNGPFCLKGEVAASPDYASFAMVGINLNQPRGADAPVGVLLPPPGAAIVYDLRNDMMSALRLLIQGPNGDTDANARWCLDVPLGAQYGVVPLEAFNTQCWSGEGAPYAGEPLESVAVYVPGDATAQIPYSFCVNTLGVK